jgi:hypothetical protein
MQWWLCIAFERSADPVPYQGSKAEQANLVALLW